MATPISDQRAVKIDHAEENDELLPPLNRPNGSIAIFEITTIAWLSLMANKMRSLLTMLGIIIGVASVVALLALGNGVSAQITGQVTSLGTKSADDHSRRSPDQGGPARTGVAARLADI